MTSREQLQRQLTEANTLVDGLAMVCASGIGSGVLKVTAEAMTGTLFFRNGRIKQVTSDTEDGGTDALLRLLAARPCQIQYFAHPGKEKKSGRPGELAINIQWLVREASRRGEVSGTHSVIPVEDQSLSTVRRSILQAVGSDRKEHAKNFQETDPQLSLPEEESKAKQAELLNSVVKDERNFDEAQAGMASAGDGLKPEQQRFLNLIAGSLTDNDQFEQTDSRLAAEQLALSQGAQSLLMLDPLAAGQVEAPPEDPPVDPIADAQVAEADFKPLTATAPTSSVPEEPPPHHPAASSASFTRSESEMAIPAENGLATFGNRLGFAVLVAALCVVTWLGASQVFRGNPQATTAAGSRPAPSRQTASADVPQLTVRTQYAAQSNPASAGGSPPVGTPIGGTPAASAPPQPLSADAELLFQARQLAAQQRFNEAATTYEVYLKNKQRDIDARIELIKVYGKLKKQYLLRKHCIRALKYHPNAEESAEILSLFQRS